MFVKIIFMKIVVIGTGYVGLVQGACLAQLGHQVVCVDVDADKIDKLRAGVIPFYEPGLPELVGEVTKAQQLKFANSVTEALAIDPEVIFIAVGTPSDEKGNADLRFVEAVAHDLASVIKSGVLVVEKSTVPVGTGKKIIEWLGRDDVEVASNPEFLREGSAVSDFMKPDRIVIGVESSQARDLLLGVYQDIDVPKIVMSRASAELSKYAANTMLASRLSLVNEFANIADAVGADILDIEKVLASDPRIGAKFLRSGAGFGGSCFPKDVLALESTGQAVGYQSRLIAPIIEVNHDQPVRLVKKIEARLGNLAGQKMAVWGLAFNKNTDDVRESPALKIVRELVARGAVVSAYDPAAMERTRAELGDQVRYVDSASAALAGARVLCVLTEWPEFYSSDWSAVKAQLAQPLVFDGKNSLPADALVAAGLEVIGIGVWRRPSSHL